MIATGIGSLLLPPEGPRFPAPRAISVRSAATHAWMSARTCRALRADANRPARRAGRNRLYIGTSRWGLEDRLDRHLVAGQPRPDRRRLLQREAALAPPPTLRLRPSHSRAGEQLALARRPGLDVEQVSHLLPRARSRCRWAGARTRGASNRVKTPLVDLAHATGRRSPQRSITAGTPGRPVLLDQQLGRQLVAP